MSLKYTAGAPKEPEYKILEPGDYDFVVNDAVEKKSKSGNPMIELKLMVGTHPNEKGVFDYLVFDGKSEWKLDSFLHSIQRHPGVGVEMDIDPMDFVGEKGRAKIKVELYNGNKSNKVQGYLFDKDAKQKPIQTDTGADTIPF
jgi:hypothetical protein